MKTLKPDNCIMKLKINLTVLFVEVCLLNILLIPDWECNSDRYYLNFIASI